MMFVRQTSSAWLRLASRPIRMAATDIPHPAKKQRTVGSKIIGTHNGTFHCDEALAVYMLRLTDAYRDADLKRTRDPGILDTCDIVVDVGAVYDESNQRFDHHQRGFEEVFGHGFATKLSSAGLIYKHFGKEIISNQLQLTPDDTRVEKLWLKLYREFIEALDGIDNGISQYADDIQPKYRNRTDLSSRVGWLNPAWNEPFDSRVVDAQFLKASQLAGEEFLGRLNYYGRSWLPARDLVFDALSRRANVDSSGRIILFDQYAPWKACPVFLSSVDGRLTAKQEHLFELEQELAVPPHAQPFYVVYPDEAANNWRIQAVPVSAESFESRRALPEPWRGVRDEVLSRLTGIEGCIFVHASGFIGGNKTKDGALEMAKTALDL
ncbi:GAMM1 protein [Russula earlei]|uniref:GAMM1 protein n=1 Tax=Russula earlei TaxID=71964 RepID=A0ACC0U097_9AGAM|nr:GAMM1 protein [Russula earlei]